MGQIKELYASLEGETSPAVLTMKTQEIPLDDPRSKYMFIPKAHKPFVGTPAAIALYGDQIGICLERLQAIATIHGGLDYLVPVRKFVPLVRASKKAGDLRSKMDRTRHCDAV